LNDSIVLVVTRLTTRSYVALSTFKVTTLRRSSRCRGSCR
jgi:hypothetical protein